MSDDSGLSASELRRRYSKGGELPDDSLSASQIRARHAIKANAKGFSTNENESGGGGGSSALLIGGVVLVIAALAAAWAMGLLPV